MKILVKSPGADAGCAGASPVLKIFVKSPGADAGAGGAGAGVGGIVPLFTIGVIAEGVAAVWDIWANSPGAGAFGMGMT